MDDLRYTDVFVPGGYPRHTYNPRSNLKLESSVGEALENLCKLVTVTGHTKSGKTVLVRKVLPRENSIWIDGGVIGTEEDFWTTIIDQLELFQTSESSQSKETSMEAAVSAKGGANVVVAKGEAEVKGSLRTTRGGSSVKSRVVSSRTVAVSGLKKAGRAIVIDDFHFLPRDLQGDVIRALKPLVFEGLPVVIIAIPHRRYDAIKVEREMTARILPVTIPSWSVDELKFIPETGFPLLHATITRSTINILANHSIGSPHLMQEFCRGICKAHGVTTSFENTPADLDMSSLEQIFVDTAETIGRPIFEKLARGPRQRKDRIPRKLKSGLEVDIYVLVLHALSHLKPDLVTLEYEDLRAAIRDVSTQGPRPPQLHEISRVLKHMSEIAATDQSSTPVIDFDEKEKVLHLTDPFFAFYLRWGSLSG